MKVTWGVAAALAVLVLLQPALILLAWHFGIKASFNTAGELASLMGAIFVAGGLIVALVALYTLANVDKAGQATVQSALEQVTTKIDERIQTFLEAYSFFRSAQDLWADWRYSALADIEENIKAAQEIEPSLHGVDVWMGEALFTVAREMFFSERYIGAEPGLPPLEQLPMLTMNALNRLEKVLTVERTPSSSSIGLQIAQLHAISGDSPRSVLHWLNRATEHGRITLDRFSALALFASCRRRDDVLRILAAFNQAEMGSQDIINHCKGQGQQQQRSVARFVVFANAPQELQNPPFNPTIVDLRSIDNWRQAYVSWKAAEQGHVGFVLGGIPRLPDFDVTMGGHGNADYESMDALLLTMLASFTFIMPFD